MHFSKIICYSLVVFCCCIATVGGVIINGTDVNQLITRKIQQHHYDNHYRSAAFHEKPPTDEHGIHDANGTHPRHKGIHIFVNMFHHVSSPLIICCWILLVSLAQVIFHSFDWLSGTIPDSCLLILLGIPVGFILNATGVTGHLFLTSDLFFQYLLPPIIFDAGYFINPTSFFNNIGTILLYAIIGTIANTFLVGASMYGIAGTAGVSISLLNSFLFGSLISAVDPVAVLTVFEEVQVNEVLYMLVFGESVLNDAASVVLYRTFEHLPDEVDGEQVGLSIASFFVVSTFGTIVGITYGLIASFITRFTDHVRIIEPLFVFVMAWLAYLTAEIFHFSGIMSILFCGVVMKPYVESNISRKSHTTIKYFLKLLASSCESVIFMFLGVALVQYTHNFNIKFIAWCIFFISIYRILAIVSLTWIANKFGRLESVSKIEQLIMSYGGLRGAVCFCLAIVLHADETEQSQDLKRLLVTTTLAVIIFTVFIQGATMKKLVEKLGVRRAEHRDVYIFEHLNDKVMSYTMAGIEEVLGVHGHGFWRNLMQVINQKFLRPCLEQNPELYMDDALFQEERKIEYKFSVNTDSRMITPTDAPPESHTDDHHITASGPPDCSIPLLCRELSSPSHDCVLSGCAINAQHFAYLIPHANQVFPRRKYSHSTVELHQDLYHWEAENESSRRDSYGNVGVEQLRRHSVQPRRGSENHHAQHHSRRHSSNDHHNRRHSSNDHHNRRHSSGDHHNRRHSSGDQEFQHHDHHRHQKSDSRHNLQDLTIHEENENEKDKDSTDAVAVEMVQFLDDTPACNSRHDDAVVDRDVDNVSDVLISDDTISCTSNVAQDGTGTDIETNIISAASISSFTASSSSSSSSVCGSASGSAASSATDAGTSLDSIRSQQTIIADFTRDSPSPSPAGK